MPEHTVHLVGSFPFDTTREVFDLCGPNLSGLLRRIPDGEPGIRRQWINWQHTDVLPNTPQLEIGGQGHIPNIPPFPTYRIKPGLTARDVQFPALGYARAAIDSYRLLKEYQALGKIDAGVRFQVSLPTPFVVSFCYFVPEDFANLWPVYEAALFAEIHDMLKVIAADELAIQWDIAAEVTVLETPDLERMYPRQMLVEGLVRAVDHVPPASQVGLHLCYGDPGGKHVIEPKDLSLLVQLANTVASKAHHPIAWLHMPVPVSRADAGYFQSLANLRQTSDTELYLGLVHLADGLEGGKRRIAAAQKIVDKFGIATECGLGRRARQQIPQIIALHAELARR
jgi:hypothetical protein